LEDSLLYRIRREVGKGVGGRQDEMEVVKSVGGVVLGRGGTFRAEQVRVGGGQEGAEGGGVRGTGRGTE